MHALMLMTFSHSFFFLLDSRPHVAQGQVVQIVTRLRQRCGVVMPMENLCVTPVDCTGNYMRYVSH